MFSTDYLVIVAEPLRARCNPRVPLLKDPRWQQAHHRSIFCPMQRALMQRLQLFDTFVANPGSNRKR
jgi:hypothetical protein